MEYIYRGEKCGWRVAQLALAAALVSLLAACGGDSGSGSSTTTGQAQPEKAEPQHEFKALGGHKTLLVQLDGVAPEQIKKVQQEQAAWKSLGSLRLLRSGGYEGTDSEQMTLPLPSWASLLTGTWATEHGVALSTYSEQSALQVPSIFQWLKRAHTETVSSLAVSKTDYSQVLTAEHQAGFIDHFTVCEQADECVTRATEQALLDGSDFIVAQYSAADNAAREHGLASSQYQLAVQRSVQQISELLSVVSARQQQADDEQWQLVLVNSYGLDEFGTATGAQFTPNKTGWLLSNIEYGAAIPEQPVPPLKALDYATIVDVTPTVLAGMNVPANDSFAFNGNDLRQDVQLSQLRFNYDPHTYALTLKWRVLAGSAGQDPVQIYRNGILLATLDSSVRQYLDRDVPAGPEGTLIPLRYELRVGQGRASVNAQVLPPPSLYASVLDGLRIYYPFKNGQANDVKQVSNFSAWNTTHSGATWVSEPAQLPFREADGTQALVLDMGVHQHGGKAGYKLSMPNSDVTLNPNVDAFTIGFWFKSNGVCIGSGSALIANKNYNSGNTNGLAIGLFGGCELRFNTGGGGGRDELGGMGTTPDEWVYVAIAVDKKNSRLYAYAMDPILGMQTKQMAMAPARVAAIGGSGQQLMGFGDDTTGEYSSRYNYSGVNSFADLAIWDRVLSVDEVRSLFASRHPISSLLP